MHTLSPFHLAIPVDDLARCVEFYETVLGCSPGRSSEQWADYNFLDINWFYITTLPIPE